MAKKRQFVRQALFDNTNYQVQIALVHEISGDRKSPMVPGYVIVNKNTGIQEGETRFMTSALKLAIGMDTAYIQITNPPDSFPAPEAEQ